MVRRAFDILGIEATKDKKAIKKAYAALVKQYHPEEHPAEWEKIHKAYQTALAFAQTTEEMPEEKPSMEISSNDAYGDFFQEAQEQWIQKKTLHEQSIIRRDGR